MLGFRYEIGFVDCKRSIAETKYVLVTKLRISALFRFTRIFRVPSPPPAQQPHRMWCRGCANPVRTLNSSVDYQTGMVMTRAEGMP